MAFMDTQPAPIDDRDGIDPYAAFRVESAREIVALLRELCDSATPVQLTGPEGASLGSGIWAVDASSGRLSLQVEETHPLLGRLLESEECTAVAYLDAVKLQFDLDDLVLVRSARACVLQARLPRHVYRFQRRQGYRVRTIERGSPVARLRHPSVPDMRVTLRVLDVSIGGCALLLPDDVPGVAAGITLHGVRIELDADTRFDVSLKVHHLSSIQSHSRGVRLGCELSRMDGAAERALQRYIDNTQKRRRLLSLG